MAEITRICIEGCVEIDRHALGVEVCKLSHEKNLIVPGDAIASFICSLDDHTGERCISDLRFASRSLDRDTAWRQQGQCGGKRCASHGDQTIYTHVWAVVHTLFALDVIFVVVMFALAQKTTPLQAPT